MRRVSSLFALGLMVVACQAMEQPPAASSPSPAPKSAETTPSPTPSPAPISTPAPDPYAVPPATTPPEFISRYAEYVWQAKETQNDVYMKRAASLVKGSRYSSEMLKGMVDSKANFACNGEDDYIRGRALQSLNTLDSKAALERARKIFEGAKQLCEIERSAADLLATAVPDEALDAFLARLKADPQLAQSDGLLDAMGKAAGEDKARLTKVQTALNQALPKVKDAKAKRQVQVQIAATKAALAQAK